MASNKHSIYNQIPLGGHLSACGIPFQLPRTPAHISQEIKSHTKSQQTIFGAGIMTTHHPTYLAPSRIITSVPRTINSKPDGLEFIDSTRLRFIDYKTVPSPIHWNGAGAIIIDTHYHRPSGKKCNSIFLFKNASTGIYELPYGKRDKTDTCSKKTAKRELEEESCNLFHFNETMFDDRYKVESSHGTQHAYIIKIFSSSGIFSKYFHTNRTLLQRSKAPYDCLEMSDITRIDIDDAICSGILICISTPQEFRLKDVYGNSITIHSRDSRFIAKVIHENILEIVPEHRVKCIESLGQTKKYLNNTISYH